MQLSAAQCSYNSHSSIKLHDVISCLEDTIEYQCQLSVVSGRWLVISGLWLVVSDRSDPCDLVGPWDPWTGVTYVTPCEQFESCDLVDPCDPCDPV